MNPSNPVFGPRGDFTTSPEISQVFGEVIVLPSVMQYNE
jgi:NADH dehydrogenase [ubiquinone] 1 alpha subcomplex assembly factor 7